MARSGSKFKANKKRAALWLVRPAPLQVTFHRGPHERYNHKAT